MITRLLQVTVAVCTLVNCIPAVFADNENSLGEALVLYRSKKFSDAREHFSLVLNAESNPEKQAEIQIQIGHTFFYEGHYAEAVENYEKILKQQGISENKKAHAQLYIAACAYCTGDANRAVQEYGKVSGYRAANIYYKLAAERQIQKINDKL